MLKSLTKLQIQIKSFLMGEGRSRVPYRQKKPPVLKVVVYYQYLSVDSPREIKYSLLLNEKNLFFELTKNYFSYFTGRVCVLFNYVKMSMSEANISPSVSSVLTLAFTPA